MLSQPHDLDDFDLHVVILSSVDLEDASQLVHLLLSSLSLRAAGSQQSVNYLRPVSPPFSHRFLLLRPAVLFCRCRRCPQRVLAGRPGVVLAVAVVFALVVAVAVAEADNTLMQPPYWLSTFLIFFCSDEVAEAVRSKAAAVPLVKLRGRRRCARR